MSANNIKVSVVLPSLNVGKYIRECLESVCNQTLKEIEIICVDAGSEDETIGIIREFAQIDSRIVIIESDKRSYGYQVNMGFCHARGKYLAVVETDDFVSEDMYEYLYEVAEENNTDITKADFDRVITLSNGEKDRIPEHFLAEVSEYYNRVFSPVELERLFCMDYFLWKGIYRRDFIFDNDIKLNETPGAAFQDMAFMQQVLSYAKRVYYSDKSLYRYRVDRDEASTYSPNLLQYAYQEFKWMFELIGAGKQLWKKGIYIHMVHSLRGELCAVLPKVSFDFSSEYIAPYYDWFVSHINKAVDAGIINPDEDSYGGPRAADSIKNILGGKDSILREVKLQQQIEDERHKKVIEVSERCKNKEVVLFGSGIRGRMYLLYLDGHCKNVAFSDNDSKKQGTSLCGYDVLSFTDCEKRYPNCIYIVANKHSYPEIVNQLTESGVSADRILVNPLSVDAVPELR